MELLDKYYEEFRNSTKHRKKFKASLSQL